MTLQLKRILERRKMSVSALARESGITQANLSNIVNGKVSPKLEILERIATTLNLEPWQLLKDEDEPETYRFFCPHCQTEFEIRPIKKEMQ